MQVILFFSTANLRSMILMVIIDWLCGRRWGWPQYVAVCCVLLIKIKSKWLKGSTDYYKGVEMWCNKTPLIFVCFFCFPPSISIAPLETWLGVVEALPRLKIQNPSPWQLAGSKAEAVYYYQNLKTERTELSGLREDSLRYWKDMGQYVFFLGDFAKHFFLIISNFF